MAELDHQLAPELVRNYKKTGKHGYCALYVNNAMRAQGFKASGHGVSVVGYPISFKVLNMEIPGLLMFTIIKEF